MATCFTEKVFVRSQPLWVVYVYMDDTMESHPFITTTKRPPASIPYVDFRHYHKETLRFKTKHEMSMYPFSLRGYVHYRSENKKIDHEQIV